MSPAGGAPAEAAEAAFAEPSLFWLCAFVAAGAGAFLALVDDPKGGGSGPTAHLSDCADSADKLFAALACDGVGLGLLEPLWRLFTPDGALWTLLTLGLGGIAAAAGTIFASSGSLVSVVGRALGVVSEEEHSPKKAGVPSSLTHEKTRMTFLMEMHAYWGYLRLFMMGVIREYIVRTFAAVLRDPLSCHYVSRERWNSGWVDFYKQHMYKLYVDCFNRPISSAPDATVDVVVRCRPGGTIFGPLHDFECTDQAKKCVNLSSYNYLGFGGVDKFCTPAARKAALEHGFSASGTRTEGGTLPLHRELEREVAKFLQKEDALVLGMGFATNSTILPALFEAGGKGILVLSDGLNHRSIVEGVRLSGAAVRAFTHNSMTDLEAQLKRAVEEGQPGGGEPWRKVFVVVEGIYSMEGDFCRLREIVTLKNRYKAFLYLDEAHSIGAVGPNGRGVTELFGVPTSEVDVMMGTFTKSFGSAGGYVAASKEVIAALRANAPGSVFASAMAPPCAAQALQALRVISGEEGGDLGAAKLRSIRENSNFFRQQLEKEGFKVLGDVDSPIIPVMLHHPQKMARFSRECLDRGIAVVVVGYPAVPVMYERVRFCISAAHTIDQLTQVIAQVAEVGRRNGVLFDKSMDPSVLRSRAERSSEYTAWLHNALLERRPDAQTAEVAKKWTPSPLAPAAAKGLAAANLAAVMDDAPRTGRDFRLLDPMGYAANPLKAAQKAMEDTMDSYGFGACGPRGFYGTTRPHLALESKIADFLSMEASIVYSAGVATSSSVLPALVQPGDRVIIDSEANLGLRTGLRLCKAEVTWTPHGDLAAIEAALKTPAKSSGSKESTGVNRTFVVVEGISQRTGRAAALPELLSLKEKYGALLILEESLSFGATGKNGRGLCELHDVKSSRVDALIGSLEHAVAGVGGFCAGRRGLVDHQRLSGSGYCFSASCPPSACSGAVATIADLEGAGGAARMVRLKSNAALLHKELQAVAAASSGSVELVSSPESFLQHLRWCKEASAGESALLAVAESCAAAEGCVRVQVCSTDVCTAEIAYGSRQGAPKVSKSSLRVCASAEHSAEDIMAASAALRKALSSR